ncbi:MAG: hypothetical protein GF401_00820 [Chitinivibrionales bacterium]|nr:hypothetical protein [Chitinivibrionales bacterium]
MKKGIPILILLGIMAFRSMASTYLGGLAGAYLRPPVGATAAAMGGAQTAAPSYLSPWWNPALLSTTGERKVSLGTGYRSLGRLEGCSSLELRIRRLGLGIMLLYRGDPYISGLVDQDEYEIDPVSYTTVTSKMGFSYLLTRRLSVGAALGIFYQSLPAYDNYPLDKTNEWSFVIGGIDLAAHYKLHDNLSLGLVLKNLNVTEDWQFETGTLSSTNTRSVPPTVNIGSQYTTNVLGKPFIWNCDVVAYLIDGNISSLDHKTAVLSNGVEWRMWESLYLRAGIGDLAFDSDIFDDRDTYEQGFSLRATAGFSADLSGVREGLRLNYGLSNSKILSGANQQVDITYSF